MITTKDIIEKEYQKPERVKLFRHALSDKKCKEYYENNKFKEYTAHQTKKRAKAGDLILNFRSSEHTTATLEKAYRVKRVLPDTPENMPVGYPNPEDFTGKGYYLELEETDIFKEYENRLKIEWGNNPRQWCQSGTIEKKVIAIKENSYSI